MSVTTASRNSPSDSSTTPSWSKRSRKRSHGAEPDLPEAMNLSYTELQELSALSEEGPRAPFNSFETQGSVSASWWDSRASVCTRQSRLDACESCEEISRRPPPKGCHVSSEVSSAVPPLPERTSSSRLSARSLVWVVALVLAFIAAFVYAVFLLRMKKIPAPEKKIVEPRSANGTGVN